MNARRSGESGRALTSQEAAPPWSGDSQSVTNDSNHRVPFDSSALKPVGSRPPLLEYLVSLWGARHFVLYDARVRLAVSQDHTMLGKVWLVLNPILFGFTFYLIFGLLLQTSRGIENFTGFIIIGFMMFFYTTRSFVAGARSISNGQNLIRGFSFPRAALPLAINVRQALSQLYVLAAMVGLVIVVPPSEVVGWHWFLIIPIFVLQTIFNWGLGMLFAPLVHRVPDVGNVLAIVTRLWMYSSGLFYEPSRFTSDPTILALFHLNPLYQVLQMTRGVMLYDTLPSLEQWSLLVVWACGVWLAGMLVFWRNEESYANERR
ncbi:ABC transporter permease [Kocuria sp.]|uniref:ABC transporter permease n=1 Tax=Kocuria sp. TaxID=1871328 RepID=UPI0026DFEF16|nr:ABC transporter permease [Kocuria sp.]MDO5617793.1 ABC transporter permease [Kocuria sp.]